MRRTVHDFGDVRLAVLEMPLPNGYIRTVTQVVHKRPTEALWKRLAEALRRAREWQEAQ